ncbi:MAG: HAD family hydrolase [Pseudomonadota bacterium]
MNPVRLVAWDFDGVLNRNIRDGKFLWAESFEADLGLPYRDLQAYMFGSGRFAEVLVGKRDILDLVAAWLARHGDPMTAEALLDYWYAHDVFPDSEIGALLDRVTCRSVIATNNEARRARYIAEDMGYGTRVARIFAAGPMGVAKPDAGFFAQIQNWARCAPAEILLVDDLLRNVEAARRCGWRAFYLTDGSRGDLPRVLDQYGAL